MPAHQDDKLAKMRTTLAVTTGTINDLEQAYTEAGEPGATSPVPNEAWMQFFDGKTTPAGHWNDRASAYLKVTGAGPANLTDEWAEFWAAP